ncbi:hypothetical protein MLD38_028994 [Melastoma candidum]|uniref:Uncharacterized protein n=1 Tax=Melastoma candidum TaxID=119954 RepID=A0ACB9N6V7_9MYRT|nr:hypothetical protein MLD38_028994 [Melastoma candidum]
MDDDPTCNINVTGDNERVAPLAAVLATSLHFDTWKKLLQPRPQQATIACEELLHNRCRIRSFTSTSFDPVTKNEYEYIKVEKNPEKRGYVRLHMTHGDLNIELHCDIAPRASMEKVPVDDNDRPLGKIEITGVTVFVNPYTDPDEEDEAKEEDAAGDKESISFQDKVGSWYSNPGAFGKGNMERPVAGCGEVLEKCSSKRRQCVEHYTVVKTSRGEANPIQPHPDGFLSSVSREGEGERLSDDPSSPYLRGVLAGFQFHYPNKGGGGGGAGLEWFPFLPFLGIL